MLRALPVLSLVFVIAGCDLLLGPAPSVVEGRPGRGGEGEEGEGEEGEGEGEGEGDPDLPPDTPAHPLGPNIQSFSISRTTLNDSQTAEITVVVTDTDGVEDIVGPLLIEPVSGTVLGTLSTSGAGTFTASVSWNTWREIDNIEFVRGNDARFIRVQFSDNAGHSVSHTERITVACDGGAPACDGICGEVRCSAQGNTCVDTGGAAVSDAALCAACNTGCTACESGCSCFNDAPRCSNGSDCLLTLDADNQVTQSQCRPNGGLRVRDDGFLVWNVDNRDLGVALDLRVTSNLDIRTVAETLCAPFGGLLSQQFVALPTDLRTSTQVFALEDNCTTSNLASGCEPILGAGLENNQGRGNQIVCVNPIDGGGGSAEFGGVCPTTGSCPGDMFCDSSTNTCEESCSIDSDCGSCAFDNPDGCHCDTSSGRCAVGARVGGPGDVNQVCIGGTFGSCTSFEAFCDNGICHEACSVASDCNECSAASGTSCTCNISGVCQVGGSGSFTHHTGLGATFTNSFPVEMSLAAAIRACNAHFNTTTCAEDCGAGSGSVSRNATCTCSEEFIWVYAGSGTHTTASPGQVTRGDCSSGSVGNWD